MPTIDKGDDSRPMNKDSEKLTVARDARNMPSRSKEKHFRRSLCCRVGGARDSTVADMIYGKNTLIAVKM